MDVHSLCSVASARKAAAAHGHRVAADGGVVGIVQDFQQMVAYRGRGVEGRLQDMLASVKGAFGGTTRGRTHMRCVPFAAIILIPLVALDLLGRQNTSTRDRNTGAMFCFLLEAQSNVFFLTDPSTTVDRWTSTT